MKNRSGRSGFSLLSEFLVIIAGIMVSFLLNEWRENKNLQEKKVLLLEEIKEDLKTDSIMLSQSIMIYKKLLNAHDSLLNFDKNTFQQDSLDMYVDCLVSYFPFYPNNRAYSKLMLDQNLSISSTDTAHVDYLLNQYLNLHGAIYSYLKEWEEVDKSYVLDHLIPYISRNASYYSAPPNKSYNGKIFYELNAKDEFKNMVTSARLYKQAKLQTLIVILEELKKIQKRINRNIQVNKN